LCFADVNQYRISHLEKKYVEREVKLAELIRSHMTNIPVDLEPKAA
jgi:hypothetical protein